MSADGCRAGEEKDEFERDLSLTLKGFDEIAVA
jgi:hypothetical protein